MAFYPATAVSIDESGEFDPTTAQLTEEQPAEKPPSRIDNILQTYATGKTPAGTVMNAATDPLGASKSYFAAGQAAQGAWDVVGGVLGTAVKGYGELGRSAYEAAIPEQERKAVEPILKEKLSRGISMLKSGAKKAVEPVTQPGGFVDIWKKTFPPAATPQEAAQQKELTEGSVALASMLPPFGGIGIKALAKGAAGKGTVIGERLIAPAKKRIGNIAQKLFEDVSGMSAASPERLQAYRDAIKAAADENELKNIQETIVRSGGNLESLADDVAVKMNEIKSKATQTLSGSVAQVTRKQTPRTPAESGESLRGIIRQTSSDIGKKYQTTEEQLYSRPMYGGTTASESFATATGGPGNKSLNAQLTQRVKRIGKDIGFKVGQEKPVYNVLARLDKQPIGVETQKTLDNIYSTISQVNTMEDALVAKRKIGDMVKSWGRDAFGKSLVSPEERDFIVKNVYAKINEVVRKTAEKLVGSTEGPAFRGALEANDKFYSESMKALTPVKKGLGINATTSDNFINKINSIGSDNLTALFSKSQEIPELKSVADEIKGSYFDSVLLKGSNTSGSFDPELFRDQWLKLGKEKPEIQRLMFGDEGIQRINAAIDNYAKEIEPVSGYLAKGGIKRLRSNLENITNQPRREEMAELSLIDDILGLQGEDRFSKQALNFARGRMLGMNQYGEIARTPMSTTGKSTLIKGIVQAPAIALGGGVGAGIGSVFGHWGAAEGAGLGGAVAGAIAGKLGTHLQSPAGNLWLYKLLQKYPFLGKPIPEASAVPAAVASGSPIAASAAVTTAPRGITPPTRLPPSEVDEAALLRENTPEAITEAVQGATTPPAGIKPPVVPQPPPGTQAGASGTNMLAGGAAGAATGAGAGAQVGDTPEERRRNMLIGAGFGLVGGMIAGQAAGRLVPKVASEQAAAGAVGQAPALDDIARQFGLEYRGKWDTPGKPVYEFFDPQTKGNYTISDINALAGKVAGKRGEPWNVGEAGQIGSAGGALAALTAAKKIQQPKKRTKSLRKKRS